MTQIHIVLRRVNPAFDVDLAQVGCIKDDQFSPLPVNVLEGTPIFDYFVNSSISSSPYVIHSSISRLVADLSTYSKFTLEFFDNTLVLMFDFNLDHDEGATEEEGKGH